MQWVQWLMEALRLEVIKKGATITIYEEWDDLECAGYAVGTQVHCPAHLISWELLAHEVTHTQQDIYNKHGYSTARENRMETYWNHRFELEARAVEALVEAGARPQEVKRVVDKLEEIGVSGNNPEALAHIVLTGIDPMLEKWGKHCADLGFGINTNLEICHCLEKWGVEFLEAIHLMGDYTELEIRMNLQFFLGKRKCWVRKPARKLRLAINQLIA